MPIPNLNPAVVSGPWRRGINSLDDPANLSDEHVQWSVNTLNRGGIYQTRPGFNCLAGFLLPNSIPRGMKLFTPLNKEPLLVVAVGSALIYSASPFVEWRSLNTLLESIEVATPVSMEVGIKGATTSPDGTLTILGDKSYPVLIVQTGNVVPIVWDGINAPFYSQDIPIFDHMKWIGNRLWGVKDNLVQAGNILDPMKFTEGDFTAEGGHFMLNGKGTGLGATIDQQSLLAFTHDSTTSFQAGILDRPSWLQTKDFKKVVFPDIGCVAPNTIVNQFGMLWWLSQKGIIGMDTALQAYRTSKIRAKDSNMARSKYNLSGDVSRACAGACGNILMLSVPSGDTYNSHTWIMDQEIVDIIDEQSPPEWASAWTGIRPVQWVTGDINGQDRCFALSVDYPDTGTRNILKANVWEAFIGVKQDIWVNGAGIRFPKRIECSVETKFLGYSLEYKAFAFVDLSFIQMSGDVHIEAFYASTHSGYKMVLSKDVIATTDSLSFTVRLDNEVLSYIPQSRVVRTSNDIAQLSDLDTGIETGLTRNKDRCFSILVKWKGNAALKKVNLFTYPSGDQVEGRVEANEITSRYVLPTGGGEILSFPSLSSSLVSGLTTQNIMTISPRWSEDLYQSKP